MRPTTLHVGGTLYWVLRTYTPGTGVLVDADSTPTVAVRKNGASVGDSVTITKRSATTGIYDCSYNPAGEVEGDKFTIEETAVISSTTYSQNFEVLITAVERGTDSALTDKTGYSLASTGLDSIAVTAPSGVATTFPAMVVQLWRRFFRKATKTSTQLKTYADDGTTVVTTQTVSDSGGTETQGAAS